MQKFFMSKKTFVILLSTFLLILTTQFKDAYYKYQFGYFKTIGDTNFEREFIDFGNRIIPIADSILMFDETTQDPISNVEIYDPHNETFVLRKDIGEIIYPHQQVVKLNETTLLIVRLKNPKTQFIPYKPIHYEFVLYDVINNRVFAKRNYISHSHDFAIIPLKNGKVLIIGGNKPTQGTRKYAESGYEKVKKAEIFNPRTLSIDRIEDSNYSYCATTIRNRPFIHLNDGIILYSKIYEKRVFEKLSYNDYSFKKIKTPPKRGKIFTFKNNEFITMHVKSLKGKGAIRKYKVVDDKIEQVGVDLNLRNLYTNWMFNAAKINDTTLLITGGTYGRENIFKILDNSAYLYDYPSNRLIKIDEMKFRRTYHFSVKTQDGVIIFGGKGKDKKTAEKFVIGKKLK